MSISQRPPTGSKKKRSSTPRPMSSHGEEATGARRRHGGRHPVLRPLQRNPRRIRPPSSGKRRDEIEHEEEQVDDRQPLGDDDHQGRCADLQKQPGRSDEDGGQCMP